jgi:hypothetical protein
MHDFVELIIRGALCFPVIVSGAELAFDVCEVRVIFIQRLFLKNDFENIQKLATDEC